LSYGSFPLWNRESKNRNRLEIIRDMLHATSVKTRKTKIMYQTNLSYPLVKKYLNGLLESGLIECDDKSCYLITPKGKDFLRIFAEYLNRCKTIKEEVRGTAEAKTLLESMCVIRQK
jgi:predicted transcriptional regulator